MAAQVADCHHGSLATTAMPQGSGATAGTQGRRKAENRPMMDSAKPANGTALRT
jgi:hypothetical protein